METRAYRQPEADEPDEPEEPVEPVSVLAVDSRPERLLTLEALLEAEGYQVATARSGEEALRHLQPGEFGAVLLDLELPGLGGLELAARLRQRCRHLPILFLGEPGAGALAPAAYAHGAADLLTRPVDPLVLRAKLAVFADLLRLRRKLLRAAARLQLQEREAAARLAEESRRAGEAHYRALAEAVPVIVWQAGPEGAVRSWNRAWTDFTGLPREAGLGQGWLRAVHPADAPALARAWAGAVAARQELVGECRLQGREGGCRWFQVRALPEHDASGRLLGWVGTLADIEARKLAEESQARAQHELQARDAFLSAASHELKTPLTSLSLGAQAIARFVGPRLGHDREGARLAGRLQGFQRQINRMTRLINDLLEATQLSAGRLPLALEEVDLVALVGQALADHAELLREAGCRLELELPVGLPARSDPRRFAQVVAHLLSNACKFGRGRPVRLTLRQLEGRAQLSISDQGLGIAPADLARIFERFERAASEHQYGGFGLGLWLTRQVVQALGGSIRVASQPGQGSTFTVELPLRPNS